jgi:hydrogenase maturation protein HypF
VTPARVRRRERLEVSGLVQGVGFRPFAYRLATELGLAGFVTNDHLGAHLERLLQLEPEVIAHDLHPEYASTRFAAEVAGVELIAVQHHHAHIASCLVDNEEQEAVIGVAFDGTGYGGDGTLWGGELLIADLVGFERLGHLAALPLPGGEAAIREPWRMAAVYLEAAGIGAEGFELFSTRSLPREQVLEISRRPTLSPRTTSAGRLLDALGALVLNRATATYEGQLPVEL